MIMNSEIAEIGTATALILSEIKQWFAIDDFHEMTLSSEEDFDE